MAYHTTTSFNDLVKSNKCFLEKGLSFFHLNTQSLRNKQDDVGTYLSQLQCSFDFLAFSETWFSSVTDVTNFSGYSHVSVYREQKRGGGVSLFIRDCFHYDTIDDFTCMCDDFETVAIMCKNIAIVCIYRPPQGTLSIFLNYIESLMDFVNSRKRHIVIIGDFNIDLNSNNPAEVQLLEIMLQNGCENVIEQPTRVTSNTSTLIDLCFTDFSKSASCSGVLCSGLSDHLPIFVALPIATRTQCTNNTIRIINDGGKKTFHSLVENLNWANIYKEPDPSVSYDIFMSELQICYDAAFPLTTIVRHKKARKECITNDLFKRIKHKDKTFLKLMI